MRRVVALALAWLMAAALIVSAQQVPTFRVGVDAIPLDVLVLDKDRHPVRGLTVADFTILENGKPQPIVSFGEVDIPDPVTPTAQWMRDVGPDVISNDLRARRLVILVLDDAYTGVEIGEPLAVSLMAPGERVTAKASKGPRPANPTPDDGVRISSVQIWDEDGRSLPPGK